MEEPIRPHALQNLKIPLHEYIKRRLSEKTLEDYIR